MSAHESHVLETALTNQQRRVAASHASKKILFVTRAYDYGGAEKHLVELIRRLCGPGLQVSILCMGADLYSERLSSNLGVDISTCDRPPSSLWDWVRLLRAMQPDVVIFVYGWSWCFHWIAPIGLGFAGVRRRFAIQHLLAPAEENRGSIHRGLLRMFGHLNLKISASLFHATICVSDALKDSLVKDFGFPAKGMRTIHNGVSLSEFVPPESGGSGIRAKLGIRDEEFVLVCVARLSDQKGIDILLQSVARVLREGVQCKCIIVGDGPLKDQLLELARQLGLSGHVFFEGFREDVRPYLEAGSVFILTSHREGLPLSILEALACGLPCVVTDVGGNAEAITHEVHGLVIPPGSVDAVANAISYLATHPHARARMSKMARVRACEAFDIESSMAEIKRVILS
jgi:glycosyltransferase involved in cell wall biosynthesis